MATLNPFDLLDDDAEDVSQLVAKVAAAATPIAVAPAQATKKGSAAPTSGAKLPSKPIPPTQAVKDLKYDGQRGGQRGGDRGGDRGGRGGDRGRGGRGGRGYNRDFNANENAFGNSNGFSGGNNKPSEDGERAPSDWHQNNGPRGGGGFRGGRRGGFNNGDAVEGGERPRRTHERRSGTGHGNEVKREGSGRGNWGTAADEITPTLDIEEPVIEGEKNVDSEKQQGPDDAGDAIKEAPAAEQEEKESEEEKEMTLEEYEKVMEEKRKALLALKSEERKVNLDKELQAMQLLSNKKKNDDEIFIKLGSDKDKKKEATEKAKKSVSINEFLKPAEGENYYRGGGRGGSRGRDRGRGGGRNSNYNSEASAKPTPKIGDDKHFPTLGK